MKKRILSLLLALVLCVGMLPAAALAAEGETGGAVVEEVPEVPSEGGGTPEVPEVPEVPGEEGGEAPVSLSVTDLHFAPLGSGTLPYLYWKAPAGVEGELRYNVYASVDQKNWVQVSSTSQELISLIGLDAAVYCAFKVETEVNDVVVAEAVSDLTLTVTQGADLPAASVVFAQPETTGGDYPITVSGLTPNTWVTFSLKRGTGGGSTSESTSDADGKYYDSESNANMERYLADKASVYLVREFSNTEIAKDGLSASYTVSNRGGWASVAAAVVGGATGEEGGEGEVTGYTLNFVYDDDLCDFSAIDWYTDEPVENGGILPINVEKNSAYGQFSISNIADGYRIASVFVNDKDRSSTFIDGAYGGCALTISEDSTITVTLEPIPEVLPDIASVAIYTGQMADKSSVLAETVTFGETLSGLHAEILFADKGSYPSYCASCLWQYSTDGKIWNDLYVWGTRTDFNAAWSGFANTIKVDFMTLENYQLRVMVTPKEYYSTAGEATCIYSAPVLVNPATGEGGETPEVPEVPGGISGTCGDNLTWTLADGVLTVSGEGAMANAYSCPWGKYADQITSAVIEEGVTTIGSYAFSNCSALTEIVIPDGIYEVCNYSFYGCTALKTIRFEGAAPSVLSNSAMFDGLSGVTVYYPADEYWDIFVAPTGWSNQYGATDLTWTAVSDSGEVIEGAVSNLCFELSRGLPNLCWTVPAGADSTTRYSIYTSTDGGASWKMVSKDSGTSTPLKTLPVGTYNAFKVEAWLNDELLGECANTDLTLTITGQTAEKPASIAVTKGSDDYTFTISGLTPGGYYTFVIQRSGTESGATYGSTGKYCDANGIGTVTETTSWMEDFVDDATTVCSVNEYINGVVNGNNATFTIVNHGETLLSVLMGGDSGEGGEGGCAHNSGTYLTQPQDSFVWPTCTSDGSYVEVVYCKDCGEELSRETFVLKGGCWDSDTDPDGICNRCGNPMPGNDFGITVKLNNADLIATITGPENAADGHIYTYYFYNTADETVNYALPYAGIGAEQVVGFKPGIYDGYKVLLTADKSVLGWGKLEKPVVVVEDAFEIPGTALTKSETADESGNYTYTLFGVDPSSYTYTLDTETACYIVQSDGETKEAVLNAGESAFANGATLHARLNSEREDAFYQEVSTGYETAVFNGVMGTTGEVYWKLEDGVLTLFGNGSAEVRAYPNLASEYPWTKYADEITAVVIEEGVTGFGAYMFDQFPNLTHVSLAGTLNGIGDGAFWGSTKLTSVSIGEGYTIISGDMFLNCTALTSITLPSTLRSLDAGAFNGCTSLKTVVFRGPAQQQIGALKTVNAGIPDATGLTLYYPANGWTAEKMEDVGANGTWVPVRGSILPNIPMDAFDIEPDSVTLQAVADAVSGATADITAGDYDFYGVRSKLLKANNQKDTTNAVVQVYVDVTLEKYSTGTDGKTLTLDITPRAQLYVNGDRTGAPAEFKVSGAVIVTIPLPEGFAKVGETVCVEHTKDNGKKYSYDLTVQQDDDGNLYVAFENENGFSTFAVTGTAGGGTPALGQNGFDLELSVEDNLLYYQLELPASELDPVTGQGDEAYFVWIMGSGCMYSCSVWSNKDYKGNMWALADAGTYDTVKVFAMDANGNTADQLAQWTLPVPITVTTGNMTLPADLALNVVEAESGANGVTYQLTGSTDTSVVYSIADLKADGQGSVYTLESGNKVMTVFQNNPVKLYAMRASDVKGYTLDISAPADLKVPAYTPAGTLTRADVCMEIVDAMGWQYNGEYVDFVDVPPEHEAYQAIAILANKKIVSGTATGEFDPNGTLTRAQLAKLLCAVLGSDGDDFTVTPPTDVDGHWAASWIYAVLNKGLMSVDPDEYNNNWFRPDDTALVDDAKFDELLAIACPMSGKFDSGVVWALTNTGTNEYGEIAYTLTVSGEGWMDKFDSYKYQPWAWARGSITKIVVGNGVTEIGVNAFARCWSVTEVEIADSVTGIGMNAFARCSELTSVTLPYGVSWIGYGAFMQCDSLTEFKMGEAPESEDVTPTYTVKDGVLFEAAWSYSEEDNKWSIDSLNTLVCCPAGKSGAVEIPATVTMIDAGAFDDCDKLTAITVAEGNEFFMAVDGVLYELMPAEMECILFLYPAAKTDATFELPAEVAGNPLCGIRIGAFNRCENLTEITAAEGNEFFMAEDGVLYGADKQWDDKLGEFIFVPHTLILYPAGKEGTSYTVPESVFMIGERAFAYAKVSEIILPSMVSICDYAFEKCGNGEEIMIHFQGEGVPGIWEKAFSGATATCYYPAGNQEFMNFLNSVADCNFGGKLRWKPVYDDTKAVTGLSMSWDSAGEYFLFWNEVEGEGEYEYRVSLRTTDEKSGKDFWVDVGWVNGDRFYLHDLPVGVYTAVRVETLKPENGSVLAAAVMEYAITVEEGGMDAPAPAASFVQMREGFTDFVISLSGLKANSPYRMIFTKTYTTGGSDRWPVTWYTNDNGTILEAVNEDRDSGLANWLKDDGMTFTYQVQEINYAMDEETGALTVTSSTCGEPGVIVWTGPEGLLDDAYAVTDLRFEVERFDGDRKDIPALRWEHPEGENIDPDELEFVVYFYTADRVDEEGNIRWDDWTTRRGAGQGIGLNLIELADKPNEYIAVKVVTLVNGVARAECTSTRHIVCVAVNDFEAADAPTVTVYRKDADSDQYTVKFSGLKEETFYNFEIGTNENYEGDNFNLYTYGDSEHVLEMSGDWISRAFAEGTFWYTLKEITESTLTEDEENDTQRVTLTTRRMHKDMPTWELTPTYAPNEVEAANIRFEIEDGTPYLKWDAPEKALKGLTYHVRFEYQKDGEGHGIGWSVDGRKTDLCDLEPAEYTAVWVITELDGMEVAEVKADVALKIVETTGSKAKLTIQDNKAPYEDDWYLFSDLTANGTFRFEARYDPDGVNRFHSTNLRSDAKGTCKDNNGGSLLAEFTPSEENPAIGEYRIVETNAVLDEDGNLTIAHCSTGWRDITDAIAKPAPAKEVEVDEKLEKELGDQAQAVKDAAANVTVELVQENVTIDTDDLVDAETGESFEIPEEDNFTKVDKGIALDIVVEEYVAPIEDEWDDAPKSLVLDITPVFTVTVTRTDADDPDKIDVQTAKAPVNTEGTPVVVTIPLPEGFASDDGQPLYVLHDKGDKTKPITHRVEARWNYETGGYYVSFINTNGFSTFTVTNEAVELTFRDGGGKEWSEIYDGLWSALDRARDRVNEDRADVTVKLLLDGLEEGYLMIPAGVTLDLNGRYVKAENVLSFGQIIDTADEVGGIVISNDRTQSFVQMQANNAYLPIYDTDYSTESGCYRFYEYEVVNLGGKASGTNAVKFGIRILFDKAEAYKILSETDDSDVELLTMLNWGKDLAYTFSAETVKKFGTQAYNDLTVAGKETTTKAITLTISGLSALTDGTTLFVQPVMESVTGTVGYGTKVEYTNSAAE